MIARGIVIGVLLTLAIGILAGYVAVIDGWIPAGADGTPGKLERWIAKTSLHATMHRDAPRTPNPVPATDANLTDGVKLYAANCIVCHGGADKRPSNIALGLYQRAPQLASDGVEDDPEGITFWKVKHGIRFTGMPGFSQTLTDTQIWTLALFLNRMDKLPPGPQRAWQATRNPVATQSPPPDSDSE